MSGKISEHIIWCELGTLQEQVQQIKYRISREKNILKKKKLEEKLTATQQLRYLLKALQESNYKNYLAEEYYRLSQQTVNSYI